MASLPYSLTTLPNGLRVLYTPRKTSRFVLLSLTGKIGTRTESAEELGAAHFIEHLFFEGTKKRPDSLQLETFLESSGSKNNGSTGPEEVEYWVKTLSEHAENAYEFLSDIFLNSLFKNSDIEKTRKIITNELTSKLDDPYVVLSDERLKILFPNNPLGRTLTEEIKNTQTLNKDLLLRYLKKHYIASNFVLAIAGNIDQVSALSLAERYFGMLPSGSQTSFESAVFPTKGRTKIIHKDLQNSRLSLSFRGYPDYTYEEGIASMVAYILGGSLLSRLSSLLRHKLHLVYNISAGHNGFSDMGYVNIVTSVEEENLSKTLHLIQEEISLLLKDGVTAEELERVKNVALSGVFSEMEKLGAYQDFFINQLIYRGKIDTLDYWIKTIKATTADELNGVAQHILSDEPKIVVLTKSLEKL